MWEFAINMAMLKERRMSICSFSHLLDMQWNKMKTFNLSGAWLFQQAPGYFRKQQRYMVFIQVEELAPVKTK